MHVPAESSQSQVDAEKAGSRDADTDGNFSNTEEEMDMLQACLTDTEVSR